MHTTESGMSRHMYTCSSENKQCCILPKSTKLLCACETPSTLMVACREQLQAMLLWHVCDEPVLVMHVLKSALSGLNHMSSCGLMCRQVGCLRGMTSIMSCLA